MLDKSGYGLIRDDWYRSAQDMSYFPENTDYSNNVKYFCDLIDLKNNHNQNLKSRFLRLYSSEKDNEPIEIKSFSIRPINLNRLEFNDRLRQEGSEFSDVNAYNYYRFKENNIYPIRNFDLLDIDNSANIDFRKTGIFCI